jgi:hypothetical protein
VVVVVGVLVVPIRMAELSVAMICGRSPTGNGGSNPAGARVLSLVSVV